jgi:hypothetical protein
MTRKICKNSFYLWAQALSANSSSISFPQHDPPIHKCLLHNLTFRHAREYSWATRILAPFSFAPMSFNTTLTLTTLHCKSNGYFFLFLKDYKLDQDLELSFNSFKLMFQHMSHLLTNGPFGMVFEQL